MKFLIGKLVIVALLHTTSPPAVTTPTHIKTIPLKKTVPQVTLPELAPAEPISPPVTPPPAPVPTPSANLYAAGQCTWYIKNLRPEIPDNWGNARDWLYNARANGWATGLTPQVNAVAWEIGGDSYGHVALVTAVNGDGTITITEMHEHWVLYQIDSRIVSASLFEYIY